VESLDADAARHRITRRDAGLVSAFGHCPSSLFPLAMPARFNRQPAEPFEGALTYPPVGRDNREGERSPSLA
jgi:hypothetical protein